ncbi:pif1, partial [Symbiodinium pilosum]
RMAERRRGGRQHLCLVSNPQNYTDGQLFEDVQRLKPLRLPIFHGMRVVFTRNVRKDIDYVNGMEGSVLSFDACSQAVEVLTETKFRVNLRPRSDMDLGGFTCYPLKGGYSDTVIKLQGAELQQVMDL